MTPNEETEKATNEVIKILEEWGTESKFIWFRELHRITDIDKGLLRNILNELKKTKVCSIDIYSGKIGIGLDTNIGLAYNTEDSLPRAKCICNCYLGNGTYDIFQIEFENKMNPESKRGLENFGTLVELDSKENFTIKDASEILSKLLSSPYGI